MGRRKVDVESLTRKLNEFRMSAINRTFTNEELYESLRALGFNKVTCGYIAGTLPYEKIGQSKLYSMPKDPIHKSVIAGFYSKQAKQRRECYNKAKLVNNESITEKAALDLLNAKGYQIRKVIGFDLNHFQKDNPSLYKKYLIYEDYDDEA